MELNTLTLSDFVRNAEILWLKGLDTVVMNARNSGLFRVETVPQETGNTREYTEIDLENYATGERPGGTIRPSTSTTGLLKDCYS